MHIQLGYYSLVQNNNAFISGLKVLSKKKSYVVKSIVTLRALVSHLQSSTEHTLTLIIPSIDLE